MGILYAVIFVVAHFDLRRQYVWRIWMGTQGMLAAVVAVFDHS